MKKEFHAFLFSLLGNETFLSTTPKDVCRFLAWKDSRGKTQVHVTSCPNLGKHNVHDCGCPSRLSFATVESYFERLREICFKDVGSGGGGVCFGDWNTALALGNPTASAEVQNFFVRAVTGFSHS